MEANLNELGFIYGISVGLLIYVIGKLINFFYCKHRYSVFFDDKPLKSIDQQGIFNYMDLMPKEKDKTITENQFEKDIIRITRGFISKLSNSGLNELHSIITVEIVKRESKYTASTENNNTK